MRRCASEEQACNAKKLKEASKSKVKAQIFDHLLYRHWNAYKEGKRSHIFVICRFMELRCARRCRSRA